MTIVFQGHIKCTSVEHAMPGQLAVTLCTPRKEADGKEWTIFVPRETAAHWLPGRAVSFTIYALPEPTP
jgi:hypothetical protein